MRCPSCGFENPEGTKFCEECGMQFLHTCLHCGHEVRATAKFCGHCGTALAEQPPGQSTLLPTATPRDKTAPARTSAVGQSALDAERRQLTVMFCDLVGSTPLAERLDPEELRTVILAYQEACAQVIRHFDGYLARYVGDGLLVYFGYPVAHDNDAQRAVQAGLGIVTAMGPLNAQLQQTVPVLQELPLQVRVGIHTGLVVVGDMGGGGFRDPKAIVGETPNLAARLQGIAEPNTVVISAPTARLIHGLFTSQALGPQALKGVSVPMEAYRVLTEGDAQSRFEVAVRTGLTPLVGRDQELGLLYECWERAKEGAGRVVLVIGEAGIGKSRLAQVLKERAGHGGVTRLECRCSPYHQNSAFYPVIELLQRVLQFQRDETPEDKLRKLEAALRRYSFSLQETAPLLAALLSLPTVSFPPLTLTPQKQKEKTQQALITWFLAEAERGPILLVWEDLHWADPSTVEFLGLLLDQVPTARLLMLLTFRPEFHPPWGLRSHLSQLTLSRLARHQAEMMVEKVTGDKALPDVVVQQIVAKTDGVPLFVEELTKTVLESGLLSEAQGHYELSGPLPPFAIPTTLQDSLMARLDRLATIREVVQLGATLGREFAYELLQAVAPVGEPALQQALTKLVEAEVLYQRGLPPQARYFFKHVLLQDAAYHSLLKSTRQLYHQQIARVLEERFAEVVETQPELVAYHYTEAGLLTPAILYWQQAGQRAVARSANREAVAHLTKGLEVLQMLPGTPEHTQQELALYMALVPPLQTTRGYANPAVEQALVRMRELCQQIREPSQLCLVQISLAAFYAVRAEWQTARELGEHCLRLAQELQDPTLLLGTHMLLGIILLCVGEPVSARAHLEQGNAIYDPQQHHFLASLWGVDPGEHCLSFAAHALWMLGYPDQALTRSHEAITLARELSHPFSLVWALGHASQIHQCRREVYATQERAEAAITLATEQGFAQDVAWGAIMCGWALAEQGHEVDGTVQLREGIAAYRASGASEGSGQYFALLAEAQGKLGRAEEGLSTLAEALAAVDKTEERCYEAELYRLKGELTLQARIQGPQSKVEAEVEECFHKAIEIARRQNAKSWELRAVISLSRLWQTQGKKNEARQLLADVYHWFTEGFDTKDLQEAKALLTELGEED